MFAFAASLQSGGPPIVDRNRLVVGSWVGFLPYGEQNKVKEAVYNNNTGI